MTYELLLLSSFIIIITIIIIIIIINTILLLSFLLLLYLQLTKIAMFPYIFNNYKKLFEYLGPSDAGQLPFLLCVMMHLLLQHIHVVQMAYNLRSGYSKQTGGKGIS